MLMTANSRLWNKVLLSIIVRLVLISKLRQLVVLKVIYFGFLSPIDLHFDLAHRFTRVDRLPLRLKHLELEANLALRRRTDLWA